ncbi:MAG: hypothetical protein JW841_09065 [Deltaproteobacteria bacterium]|nr:hypothetical protein [Deltaproteobacteria bacterium]
MANNLESYQRFTAQPGNISQFGNTVEEIKLQYGKPDPNPVFSPMPEHAVTDVRLALAIRGSDRIRLASPTEPLQNPFEGQRISLVLTRNAYRKLKGKALLDLQDAIEDAEDISDETKSLMVDSIRRVIVGLGEYLNKSISLTEGVYARCIASSKG